MTVVFYTALFLFVFLCVVLCLAILVQESKTLGLGASFGGDPGESLFGTSTADVLKKFTAWLGAIFLISCVMLSFWSAELTKPRATQVVPLEIEQITP